MEKILKLGTFPKPISTRFKTQRETPSIWVQKTLLEPDEHFSELGTVSETRFNPI